MSDRSLTPRDYARLHDILELTRPDHAESPQERMFQVLEHLEALVGCDEGASLQAYDSVHRARTYCQWFEDGQRGIEAEPNVEEDDDADIRVFWNEWWHSPCSLPERTGAPVAVSLRSVYGEREWLSTPLRTDYLPWADEILLGYPTRAGQSARFLLPRAGGSVFGARELMLVELLMPHLRTLVLTTVGPQGGPRQSLSPRQVEILRQVALGLTNREIGRSVGIAEATVRKHLEIAYHKLGVLSRAGAVAAMSDTTSTA